MPYNDTSTDEDALFRNFAYRALYARHDGFLPSSRSYGIGLFTSAPFYGSDGSINHKPAFAHLHYTPAILSNGHYYEVPRELDNSDYYISSMRPYYNIYNISNKRKDKQLVASAGNDLTNEVVSNFYINDTYSSHREYDFNGLYLGGGFISQEGRNPSENMDTKSLRVEKNGGVVWYYLKVYKNFYLQNYFIGVPKGTWLPNGKRMPENGFYDLITQKTYVVVPEYHTNSGYMIGNTSPDAYVLGKPATGTPSDYFEVWYFVSTDVNYIGQTTEASDIYKYPDIYSQRIASLNSSVILPITKETSDAANRVIGTWYFVGCGWIQANRVSLLPNSAYDIQPLSKTITLKGDTSNTATTYYSYLGPDESMTTTHSGHRFTTEQRIKIYFECNDFYFTRYGWIPAAYTDDNIVENTNVYIVAVDSVNIYSYPLRSDTYKVKNELLGERLQAVANLVKDPLWIKLGPDKWVFNQEGHLTLLEQ